MNPINERFERIEIEKPVLVKGVDGATATIFVKVPALKDPEDGEIYLDAEAIEIMDKARARHYKVLAPQQLLKLRDRLGLTQLEIAELLQIGEKTWSRWESGRDVPSKSLNLLLLSLYEGKIDISYLKSKLQDGATAQEPTLISRGWEDLLACYAGDLNYEQKSWGIRIFDAAPLGSFGVGYAISNLGSAVWMKIAESRQDTAERLTRHSPKPIRCQASRLSSGYIPMRAEVLLTS